MKTIFICQSSSTANMLYFFLTSQTSRTNALFPLPHVVNKTRKYVPWSSTFLRTDFLKTTYVLKVAKYTLLLKSSFLMPETPELLSLFYFSGNSAFTLCSFISMPNNEYSSKLNPLLSKFLSIFSIHHLIYFSKIFLSFLFEWLSNPQLHASFHRI